MCGGGGQDEAGAIYQWPPCSARLSCSSSVRRSRWKGLTLVLSRLFFRMFLWRVFRLGVWAQRDRRGINVFACSVSVGRRVQDLLFQCYPLRFILKGNRYSPLYVQLNDSFRYSRIFSVFKNWKRFPEEKKIPLILKIKYFLEKYRFSFI